MALNQLGLGFVFTAKDLASGVIGRVENAFGGMEEKAEAATRNFTESQEQLRSVGLAIAGAGVAIIGTAAALAVQAAQFEDAIARAGARAGLSADEMERFRDAAFEVTATVRGFSAEEAARTLQTLAEEGFNAADGLKLLRPTLLLASATGMAAAATAGFFTDVLSAFNISADDAGGAADRMAFAMRRFGIASSELQPLLFGVARGASLAGASFDDALLAVGLAKSVLPEAGQAAAAANMAMLQLADPSIAAKLRAQGVAVTDASGRMRPLIDILGELAERTEGMTEARRAATVADIFGGRAAGGMAVILNQLSSGVRDASGNIVCGAAAVELLRGEMAGAAGTAEEMADRVLGTLSGQIRETRAAVSTLATGLGELFVPIFKPIVKAIADFARTVATAIGRMPPRSQARARRHRARGRRVPDAGRRHDRGEGLHRPLRRGTQGRGRDARRDHRGHPASGCRGRAAGARGGRAQDRLGAEPRRHPRLRPSRLGPRAPVLPGDDPALQRGRLLRRRDGGAEPRRELGRQAVRDPRLPDRLPHQALLRGDRRGLRGRHRGRAAGVRCVRQRPAPARPGPRHRGHGRGERGGRDPVRRVRRLRPRHRPDRRHPRGGVRRRAHVRHRRGGDGDRRLPPGDRASLAHLRRGEGGGVARLDRAPEARRDVRARVGPGSAGGGAMDALGTVAQFLGFVIGNVAAFIAGAIGLMVQFVVRRLAIVIAAFRSVVGFIQGVIDIVAGIVTGDWARVWTGFKNVVLNVLNFIAQIVLGFVETVASVIDSIAGIFGADLGAADAIRSLREDIEKGLVGGVDVATAGVDVRPTAAPGTTPGAATAAFPAATAAEAQFAALERAAGGGPPVRVEAPPVTTNVNLTVDGEVLARAVARAERGGAARSFVPVPVPG